MKVQFKLNARQVTTAVRNMRSEAGRASVFWTNVKPSVRAHLREHGEKEEGPEGRWPERAPATLDQRIMSVQGKYARRLLKRKRRRAPRKMLGKLTKAFRYQAGKASLTVSSPIPWAAIHNEGGVAGRGATIPERPFLWIGDQFHQQLADSYAEFVLRRFK